MPENIFMIHGMFVGGWYWENYKNFFESKGYRCVCPTLPGHDANPGGPPPGEVGTLSVQDYVSFLEEELGKLDSPPVIMGHSMGGLLAQILMAKGLAKKAVLLSPAQPAGVEYILAFSVIKSFSECIFKWGFWNKPFKPSFDLTKYSIYHLSTEDYAKEMYSRMVHESGRSIFQIGYWYLDSTKGTYVDETRVSCPVLIISGAEDRITPSPMHRKIARKYAGSEILVYEGHAHNIMGEAGWESIAGDVLVWIERPAGVKNA